MAEQNARGDGDQEAASPRAVHENLDTSYVNLAALVRYLEGREFTGRVHVALRECDGDIFLRAGETPYARETDHASACEEEGDAALRRLFVRAGEPGGLVSIYEGADESARDAAGEGGRAGGTSGATARRVGGSAELDPAEEWLALLELSGELVATVERGVSPAGGDFVRAFGDARAEMADDYPFLDPGEGRFGYDGRGPLRFRGRVSAGAFGSGVCEALRRAVERLAAAGNEPDALRGRVAGELSVLSRRRQSTFQHFKLTHHLERIAGTRLL